MKRRSKKLRKGIESLKEKTEEHFIKLEKDIQEDNKDGGRYHANEIDHSFIAFLEKKIRQLGKESEYANLIAQ